MLEPQDFRDVLAVARAGSLKGAALALGVDPATAGRRLEAAEARLGARLFVRSARRLEATPEGREVVEAAERLEEVQLAFERDRLGRAGAQAGVVTLTSAEWGIPLLTPLLVELGREHPGLQLRLRIENRALDLARREADLALRIGRPAEKALSGRRVGVARYGLYASSAYLASRGRPRTAADLEGHALCTLDDSYARTPQARWLSRLAPRSSTRFQSSSLLALIEAVRAGAGIAALPAALAGLWPDLERVLPESGSVERDLWIVFHRDLRRSRGVRALVDALVARLRPVFSTATPQRRSLPGDRSAAPATSR
ncbi:MAG: LysR family transcriptional regulator [Anaeromyxobacter sp.]